MNKPTAMEFANKLQEFCDKNNLWYEKTEKNKPDLSLITITIAIKVKSE